MIRVRIHRCHTSQWHQKWKLMKQQALPAEQTGRRSRELCILQRQRQRQHWKIENTCLRYPQQHPFLPLLKPTTLNNQTLSFPLTFSPRTLIQISLCSQHKKNSANEWWVVWYLLVKGIPQERERERVMVAEQGREVAERARVFPYICQMNGWVWKIIRVRSVNWHKTFNTITELRATRASPLQGWRSWLDDAFAAGQLLCVIIFLCF